MGGLEARQRLGRHVLVVDDGVADAGIGHFLDRGGEEADFAGRQLRHRFLFGAKNADALDRIGAAGGHHLDLLALLDAAFLDAHEHDDAEVGVIPTVDQQGLQGCVAIAGRRRQALHDRFEDLVDVQARFGRDADGARRIDADDVLDLLLDALLVGRRQVDLVQDGENFEIVLERLIDVGERLRLDPLGGIDHQHRALAGRQRARHFVGEIDVAGRVHQIELIEVSVLGLVVEADRLGFDCDAALALDVHRVEDLVLHLAVGDVAAQLDQPVRQGRFAVVDVGDDGEIADQGGLGHALACITAAAEIEGKREMSGPWSALVIPWRAKYTAVQGLRSGVDHVTCIEESGRRLH